MFTDSHHTPHKLTSPCYAAVIKVVPFLRRHTLPVAVIGIGDITLTHLQPQI